MAKGVKKIKWVGSGGVLGNHSLEDTILCVRPNEEAPFVVGEWYNETPEEDKRRDITWLWMDQKRRTIFKRTIKPAGIPYGVNLPKKLCGNYAFYLEASLYGGHDHRKTGLHVYGKCDEKIISSSWSKKENAADHSAISYGDDLFITLEAEGINGNSLTLQLYSARKTDKALETVRTKCVDGRIKATFKTMSCYWGFPGLPDDVENFYIKVIDIKEDYIKNASGNDKILSFNIIKADSIITIPVFEAPTNTAPLTIDVTPVEEIVRTEGIVTAYFAKEEFSLETSEAVGQHEYVFKTKNAPIDRDKAAKIIKQRVDAQVKADKKYAKLDDIKNALTENNYDIGDPVSFDLYKLGANYIKINNAPLEEEVYVVAKTFLLDGKEVSITIKEKEAIMVDADAAVPVLEAKEDGAELTTLKATVENGIAKVKVKLRPKADEDLKVWKEKLLKGKKEETYTYTFKSEKTTITDDNKNKFAGIILKNAKEGKQGNTKIATGKTAFADDVEKALVSKDYISGDTISFDIYKTQAESLWLKAECQGETVKHEKEFLKRDGEYFVIGKKCECEARIRAFMRMLRVGEGTGELIKSYDYNKKETIYIPHDFQKGYTTAFGGNEITDLSTHPNKVYSGGSSAAGAYQIMGYTYAWLGGSKLEWTGKYFKVLDVYESYHDYRKTYNIIDYQPESQDKLCICLMKDRKGMLELIIDGKIEEAIRKFGSSIYASLPHEGDNSKYELNGKPQPATPMDKCLSHYETFLKQELADKSNLHLKKGFLKDFKIECCNKNEIKPLEGKGWNIDIHLWSNRKDMGYGILVLKNDNNQEVWRTIVRAQGYSNKIGESRTQKYGDTPTGVYKFENWRNDGSSEIYGSNHRLDMTYESGEAKAIGREEIQIHGGRQANESNPYLWNTGGCLRVFDDAIATLKKKVENLEKKSNKKENHLINVDHTLKYDTVSKKYFTPDDYLEVIENPENEDILKKGITNNKYYKNESNYYTDNLTD
ncbi:glycoside hydrolase family 24 protein [Flavobacterium hibisci]|uniref:glycoside hydrolase family 24 protein n=1 Tax=Flavobacterium hibisci TaxID=1914462 RepID=UPI001CC02F18|nr:glycoside hydrolase family 104 protein [Flavobacterium hibisci]MBZ4043833.1 glycoside hydrolase family 104 protein [Flavobacterium hibisci]